MKNILAKKNLCFLALLEMILEDYTGISCFSQESLVDYFGITMLEGQEAPYSNVLFTNDKKQIGVHLSEEKLNGFFMNTGIPLKTIYIGSNPYHEYSNELFKVDAELSPKYMVFTFSYGSLYNNPDYVDIGHAVLYKGNIDADRILIYDPGPNNAGIKTIRLTDMYEAMWARHGGIYCFYTKE